MNRRTPGSSTVRLSNLLIAVLIIVDILVALGVMLFRPRESITDPSKAPRVRGQRVGVPSTAR